MSNLPRLADRVVSARHSRFVGRAEELQLFQLALVAEELSFSLLYLYGPGGVGKTALLHEFAYICREYEVPCFYLDARDVQPSPDSILKGLAASMGLPSGESSLQLLSSEPSRQVLIIDSCEMLAPMEGWLRHDFLPQLSQNVLVVMASTDPLSSGWRTDPGWQSIIRVRPLRNLTPEESQLYLDGRAVAAEQRPEILQFTHGHPLALTLAADLLDQKPGARFQPESSPEMIGILLAQLVRGAPEGGHRAALEACAVVRHMTEPLLAAMLRVPDARPLFEWLRGLSSIQSDAHGMFPHDLVRDVLVADLRWRNPDCYGEFHRRARIYYGERLREAGRSEQQRILLDYLHLHRDNPLVRPFFEWREAETLIEEAARESDLPALTGMVAEHEGEQSALIMAHWFHRQPEGVTVFRDDQRQIAGLLATVALHRATAEDLQTDPVALAAWEYLRDHAPLRSGEGAAIFRFWMARDGYQSVSPEQSLIFAGILRYFVVTPGLTFSFLPCADPDFWAPVLGYADLTRIAEMDFEIEGRRYGVYGHDWRTVPVAAWFDLLSQSEVDATTSLPAPRQMADPMVVLSQPDFQAAVRRALRDYSQPVGLRGNPLLRSRLVAERMDAGAGPDGRVATLKRLVLEAAESLRASPRTGRYFDALYHTHFRPAPSQERAAELLDLPFSTFRRHLRTGIDRVTDILWRWEIDGTSG